MSGVLNHGCQDLVGVESTAELFKARAGGVQLIPKKLMPRKKRSGFGRKFSTAKATYVKYMRNSRLIPVMEKYNLKL